MKICLGSAQFGLDYGITNSNGKVPEQNVKDLINIALSNGINLIDTASCYGSAEKVLGISLPKNDKFKISTKLPPQLSDYFVKSDIEKWENTLLMSCKNIRKKSLDSFLIHNTNDLKKPGSKYLVDWLINIKERGLVKRLGVSIYEANDLFDIPRDLLDLVQLPLSIYDQRLIKDGTIENLNNQGIAIHARSLYLQGLILLPTSKWPPWVKKSSLIQQKKLEELAKTKCCELIDLAIGFAKTQGSLEAIIVGICNKYQLYNLLNAWGKQNPWLENQKEWEDWSSDDKDLIDPRKWQK
tara:strand:+ start:410 stop:1300 length:891 start_codon:yes stop_codon:yes gene_type:complete